MSTLSNHLKKLYSFPKSSFSFTMKIILVTFLFLAVNVAADDVMTTPQPRTTNGNNNYPCGNSFPGKILTNYTINETINVKWQITETLSGSCYVDLSTTGKDTNFTTISTIPNCAGKVGDNFQTDVKLPENITCERCTIRFRLIPSLSKDDVNLNCADVSILPKLKKRQSCGCPKCCQKIKKRNWKKRSNRY